MRCSVALAAVEVRGGADARRPSEIGLEPLRPIGPGAPIASSCPLRRRVRSMMAGCRCWTTWADLAEPQAATLSALERSLVQAQRGAFEARRLL